MEVVERNVQNVSREITSLVSKIDDEASEQTTCDRVKANSHKRIKKIREEIAQKEIETQNLHNEIARVTVDGLNREYDEKRTKLEAEAGEADVAGPQEAKLKHMKKSIADLTKECSDMQKDWIQKQTQLLSVSTETDRLK